MNYLLKYSFIFIFVNIQLNLTSQDHVFVNRGIGGGGALFAPSINPHDNSQLYMACDMTQLFYSENFGDQWTMVPFQNLVCTAQSDIQFTNDPNTMWTVGYDFRNDITYPTLSSDGGMTWNFVNTPQADGIIYLYADYDNSDRFIVSDYRRIYFTNDASANYSIAASNANGTYVAGAVWDGPNIYIGTNYGVTYSTDNGVSFQDFTISGLPANTGFASLGGVATNSQTILTGVVSSTADLYPWVLASDYGGYAGVFKYEVGVDPNWIDISPLNIPSSHKFFRLAQSSSVDTIYIAGTDSSNSFPIIYKTIDGGDNWVSIFKTINNTNIETGWCGHNGDENWWYAESPLGFTVSASNPDHMVITDFGAVHVTLDGGASWQSKYTDQSYTNSAGMQTPINQEYQSNGLENTSSWWLHWEDDQHLIAAFSDVGGVRSNDGGLSWTYEGVDRNYNSTYHLIEHPSNDYLYAATSSVHDMYQSTRLKDNILDPGTGAILMTNDQGSNWTMLHDFEHPVMWLALSPDNDEEMYASVVHSSFGGIYKTSNLSAGSLSDWVRLSEPSGTEGHPFNIHALGGGKLLSSYSGRREDAGPFTASSGIFYSDNDGVSWSNVGTSDMDYWTKDVVVDPHDPTMQTWYACVFSGWGGAGNTSGGVYRTQDKGANWDKIADHYRVESVSVHPDYSNIMYITTEDEGLWISYNIRDANPVFQQIESYDFQHPVRVFFEPSNSDNIWVSSFGNGLRLAEGICWTQVQIDEVGLMSGVYAAEQIIMSKATINQANVEYRAGDSILLEEKFAVQLGSVFHAHIIDCE